MGPQARSETENGWRRILLPPHTVESIREAIEYLKTSGQPNPMGLLFPSRVGTVRNPNNFGRTWRAARGEIPDQWMLHCHNVYRGEAGMMSVLSYVSG